MNPRSHLSAKRKNYTISARDFTLSVGERTAVMGIINVTPDSFSQDGCIKTSKNYIDTAVRRAKMFARQGVDILDIGGESSRPGAATVSIQEEANRIIPVITKLAKQIKVPISVDTYKPQVAKMALEAGASFVNTIRGITLNKSLLKVVKNYHAAIILMHMKGNPRTMQKKVKYTHLIAEIKTSLKKSIEKCLENGVKSDKIIIDPGIGFGKTVEHNLEIINQLQKFKSLNCPILIGTSRKSFIGITLKKDAQHRLMGSAATVCASIMNGAHIVRVHDVNPIKDVVKMTDAILNQKISHP